MPSGLKQPRTWLTRGNPFMQDWQEIGQMLTDTPDLQTRTIFDILCEQHISRYAASQLRTLQRHIRRWHILQKDGKSKNIHFPQCHVPKEAMQGDLPHTGELKMAIQKKLFLPLLSHNTLPYC